MGWIRGVLSVLLLIMVQQGNSSTDTELSLHGRIPIRAAFEPLPPQISADGGGLVQQVFERLERQGLGPFLIQMMPYSRAKRQLLSGEADLAGFTPFGREVEGFYRQTQEVRWPYPVNTDFISLTPIRRDTNGTRQGQRLRVGTPYGNEAFASQMLGVPIEQFDLAELDELVLMLLRGRVDLIWFERAALHQALAALPQHPTIYFQQAPSAPIALGLALQRDDRGERIKQQLQQAFETLALPPLPDELQRLNGLGQAGVIPAKSAP